MILKVAARKSDLARLQAYRVGEALRQLDHSPVEKIDYVFKSSLGDDNQDQPLWKMPTKGVFTQDLTEDLISGRVDLVVHSWKDLPTELPRQTEVVATLPRADQRDLLLFKKESSVRLMSGETLRILSSSPRRAYNLTRFLPTALPGHPERKIQFKDIRGNIPTRLTKLLADSDADGLVVAKAALDRLLSATEPEFASVQAEIRIALALTRWMVLPLRENPTAAGQGALAVEILNSRNDLKKLLLEVNCPLTFANVSKERAFLASKGGGCHQKIGVSYLGHLNGIIISQRGQTDEGETLLAWRFEDERRIRTDITDFFPKTLAEGRLLKSIEHEIDLPRLSQEKFFWLAKCLAWPKSLSPDLERSIWVAGSETWLAMAGAGHWVTGSSEGLGEGQGPALDIMAGNPLPWLKLTHLGAIDFGGLPAIGTYGLVSDDTVNPDLTQVTHFFWTSYSNFEEGIRRFPEIRFREHACGPGKTAELIRKSLGSESFRLKVFLSYEEWREGLPRKKSEVNK